MDEAAVITDGSVETTRPCSEPRYCAAEAITNDTDLSGARNSFPCGDDVFCVFVLVDLSPEFHAFLAVFLFIA